VEEYQWSQIDMRKQARDTWEKKFDKSKPPSYIMHYDAYNLYGWAMSQKYQQTDLNG